MAGLAVKPKYAVIRKNVLGLGATYYTLKGPFSLDARVALLFETHKAASRVADMHSAQVALAWGE